ncbi:phage tail sheath subtilisin-like domain-containing protein [Novosphingopyxis sp. YJ-S2-01]|uniref:phage tail sheath subtilisin-like domain-containing protein n=1 Tax=Novosphingopyxis sp. YJ-S2-01 TaxID=2794021 RepID=UPI0018DCBAC3|nr:phage tail sheath subtilisin-like domain-containing protein [Novosphingopyxis sp. YJ-S2-01]MBH9537907.1 phage tail sheath subtilisin-like domain-containing protein [Novosphingopyxis sp. YJ-S2-01]
MPLHHGVKLVEATEGARPLRTVSTAVIGLVATADDADAQVFPLNVPVQFTDLAPAIAAAGTTGTLRATLEAIADQVRTIVQIVRVAEGADSASTSANAVGTVDGDGRRTGVQALRDAESLLGVRPRILGAPGLDDQAVTAALVSVAQELHGFVYAEAPGPASADAIGYRANFGQRELMLIAPRVKVLGREGAIADAPATAYALGLRAKIDQEVGWHKTLSNVAINGVLGTSRPIGFDLQSSATDAGILNDADITTVIRRDGFRFWGNRTCSEEPLFAFESAVRTAQVLRDTIADGLMWAIDKPLRPGLVKDILSTINHKVGQMKAQGLLIGGEARYDPAKNDSASLSAGQLFIDYDFTPVPPAESIHLTQTITDTYFADFGKLAQAA